MRITYSILYLLLFVMLSLFSCKKDSGELPPTPCKSNWLDEFAGTYRCLKVWSHVEWLDTPITFVYNGDTITTDAFLSIDHDTVDLIFLKPGVEPHCDSELIHENKFIKIEADNTFRDNQGATGKFYSTNGLTVDSVYKHIHESQISNIIYRGKKI